MERTNYPYYENNILKDQSQQGQNSKMGKKASYKYYKGGSNKNNAINQDDKMSTNSNEHHYRNPRRKNFPDNGQNINFKKKNKKKRDNNEYAYQGNNAIEINSQSKEEFIEQPNNMNMDGNNNHQHMYAKQYKKNPNHNVYNNNLVNNNINSNLNNTIGSLNTNPNSSNNSNLSNVNLTPQGKNQITTPIGFNINNSNSPLNNMMPQQPQNTNQKVYLNPKIFLGNIRPNNLISENDQDRSLKDEKSSENLSEESMSTGRNILQNPNEANLIDMNKNQNEFLPDFFINNNKFLQQPGNYFPLAYNMNNNINNNLENINHINTINNNFNNINNLSNYNQNLTNQLNNSIPNMNNINLGNLSLNNFQRQMYENQNNKIFNTPQMQQNYTFPNNDDMIMNHKKIKKIQSPIEQSNLSNPSMNLGNLINLNYNGPNNKFIKNPNNGINMNNNTKTSLSSQPPKNTVPQNFAQAENLNLLQGQNKQIPPILNMNFNPLNNRNFFVPQNMRNSHINNNYINNNHLNNNNNINNKDFHNMGYNHNNMGNNNKKYQKQYNYNSNQTPNSMNNNANNQMYNKSNKALLNNDLNANINNYALNNNNTQGKNYNLRSNKDFNSHSNSNKSNLNLNNNKQTKQYLLCLNLKLENNKTELIKIKTVEDCPIVLKELKENKNIPEKVFKLIQNKIYEAIEIIKKIYNFGLEKSTYKNLCEIKNSIGNNKEKKKGKKLKKINSMKNINNPFKEEMSITKNDYKNCESLSISLLYN